jgi:hypothetical protein
MKDLQFPKFVCHKNETRNNGLHKGKTTKLLCRRIQDFGPPLPLSPPLFSVAEHTYTTVYRGRKIMREGRGGANGACFSWRERGEVWTQERRQQKSLCLYHTFIPFYARNITKQWDSDPSEGLCKNPLHVTGSWPHRYWQALSAHPHPPTHPPAQAQAIFP